MSNKGDQRNRQNTVLISGAAFAICAAALLAGPQDIPRVDAREVRKYVGKSVTACGLVTTYHCPRPQRTTYLDLDSPYWEEGISVAIPAGNRPAFGVRVEDRYASRTVCATGRVQREDKRYVITVSEPFELRIDREPQPLPVRLEPTAVRACDDGVELPQPITRAKPEYPPGAQAKHREGIVLLDGVVMADGSVGDVVVVHSLDAASGLDGEAVRAFKKWRFSSGTVAGRPTPVVVGVQIKFEVR
jgi:TonB family protein